MDLLINNPFVIGAISLVFGSAVSPVVLAVYKAFKIKDKIQAGAVGILELAGTSSAKKIKMIKDVEIRTQVYNDVRESADKLDDAFIKGLDEEMNR